MICPYCGKEMEPGMLTSPYNISWFKKGKRGKIQLDRKVKILNMLEEEEYETDVIEYKPFEIITIGI